MSSVVSEKMAKPHAVCVPVAAQGHIHATLKLARLLHFKGFHITFVHSDSTYKRILANGGTSALRELDGFRFETMTTPDLPWEREGFTANFRALMGKLSGPSSGVPPVTCIISDVFASFTLEVAEDFGIPDVLFCSASACGYLGSLKFKELAERGIMPSKSEKDASNDLPIDWIPGMKNIRLRDLPSFTALGDNAGILFDFVKDEAQAALRASAIIINTFDDLEGKVLDALTSLLPPVYTVGPLTLLCRQIGDCSAEEIGSNNFWKEDSNCLKWLDERKPGSVLYINFGSVAVMSNEQFMEFAWGVANSGHDFLWVIRPDLVKGESAALTEEYLNEINSRGLLVGWCPQEDVLMHPSVGGFLTHCGWNSSMESISAGVPMICWPYFADQLTNCRYACSEWEIGLEIDADVRREEVERAIRELMGGEKGKMMRRKAIEWKEAALEATNVGGKSGMNLDRVIKEVLLKRNE